MRPSPLLQHPGAVASPQGDLDSPVPAHYGSCLCEQVLLVRGDAATLLARDVVTVTGPDRLSWLTTLGSQVLTSLAPDDGGAETLILDATGRISHALAAVDDGSTLWLVTECDRGQDLVDFLESMRFMLRVEVAVNGEVAVVGALGEGVDALTRAARQAGALLAQWRDPWPGVTDSGTAYDVGLEGPGGRAFRHPGAGYRAGYVLVPDERVEEVLGQWALAGSLAWEALRIEAGRPRWGREVDERTIPHELDWLRTAVHLAKGCYPGQETVARTLNLGRPPRRLTLLQLDGLGGDLPAPGDAVRLGTRRVGAVTSVARHHELGPMALALLRRGTPLDEDLVVVGAQEGQTPVAARQEPLVTPEGRAGASPAERPGAGLRSSLLGHRSRG